MHDASHAPMVQKPITPQIDAGEEGSRRWAQIARPLVYGLEAQTEPTRELR